MNRELDADCARALGKTVIVDYETISGEQVPVGWWDGPKDDEGANPILHYSDDYAASRLLEDEIERRGLQEQYILALGDVVTTTDSIVKDMLRLASESEILLYWRILRATPEQRAWAFLEAIKA